MVFIEAQNPGPSTYLLPRAFPDAQGFLFSALLGSAMLSVSMISKFTNYYLLLLLFPSDKASKFLENTSGDSQRTSPTQP